MGEEGMAYEGGGSHKRRRTPPTTTAIHGVVDGEGGGDGY